MKYKLELESTPNEKQRWLVRGLTDTFMTDEPKPDLVLHPGMFHSCDSAENLTIALHEELYGLLQTHAQLRDGDEFISEACTVNMFHNHDASMGTFAFPALRFICRGVHVAQVS